MRDDHEAEDSDGSSTGSEKGASGPPSSSDENEGLRARWGRPSELVESRSSFAPEDEDESAKTEAVELPPAPPAPPSEPTWEDPEPEHAGPLVDEDAAAILEPEPHAESAHASEAAVAVDAPEPSAPTLLFDLDQEQALPRAWVKVERISGWITLGILGGGGLIGLVVYAFFVADEGSWGPIWATVGWVAFVLNSLWWGQFWPAIAWKHIRYRVDARGLEIRRGVVWRSTETVPISRVQHTDVSRGPLQRRHGLATLILHTAGNTNATISLSGLEAERAESLRDYLIAGTFEDAV